MAVAFEDIGTSRLRDAHGAGRRGRRKARGRVDDWAP
jgi:hypothetical protein